MKKNISRVIVITIIIIWLQACNTSNNSQIIINSTSTNTIALTWTITNTPTLTITSTKTISPTITSTPTITPTPKPVTITGIVSITKSEKKPFTTIIELHEKATYLLISKVSTNQQGAYEINNVKPGNYDLWILLTNSPKMIFGCNDITIQNAGWKMGIKFSEDTALTMGAVDLSKAIILSENLDPTLFKVKGFYAVLENYAVLIGPNSNLEVTLLCK